MAPRLTTTACAPHITGAKGSLKKASQKGGKAGQQAALRHVRRHVGYGRVALVLWEYRGCREISGDLTIGRRNANYNNCINCIGNNCPQAVQCVTDPVCMQGTICAVQNCISGGNPDLICVLNCFNGDLGTALLALQSVGCIFNQCGNECSGIFGGGP